MKEVGISPDLLDQKCSDEHLKSISLFLDWRSVAPHLGLSERDIEAIEAENRRELERSLKVLQKWKKMYGYTATFRKLMEAILVVRNAEDAERVCRLLKTPAGRANVCIIQKWFKIRKFPPTIPLYHKVFLTPCHIVHMPACPQAQARFHSSYHYSKVFLTIATLRICQLVLRSRLDFTTWCISLHL